jgi:hypothetical protein
MSDSDRHPIKKRAAKKDREVANLVAELSVVKQQNDNLAAMQAGCVVQACMERSAPVVPRQRRTVSQRQNDSLRRELILNDILSSQLEALHIHPMNTHV